MNELKVLARFSFAQWVLFILFCALLAVAHGGRALERRLPWLFVLILALSGCMSTKVLTVGQDKEGRPKAVPVFVTNADVVGEISLSANAFGTTTWDLKAPPLQDYPVMRIPVLDRKGTVVLAYQEIPMVPGIYPSRTHTSFLTGLGQVIRQGSNLVGTGLSSFFGGLIGLEWARQGVLLGGAAQ